MSGRTRTERKALGAVEESKVVPLEVARPLDPPSRPAPPPPIVSIHLLGSMRAVTDLGHSIVPRGRKARALLGYLCLAGGESVGRARLASMLWDRVPDHQARMSFRQSLRELSASMGPLADQLISGDRDSVRLDPKSCWIDAIALLSSDASAHSRADLVSLCAGQLLEGLDGASVSFDHWLLAERTRFNERLRGLLEAELHNLGRSNANAERRAEMARHVIAFDATHEGACRTLMRALADMGERAQALREFERCREALKAILDVEPSPETRALHQAMRTFSGREKLETVGPPEVVPAQQTQKLKILSRVSSRLRVGVLPFQGAHSLRSETLALSLSQEIAAALARFRWFDVIAPVSLPRGFPAGASETVFRRKQLHYLVDGGLSGDGEKFQISVRLLDVTEQARPVWSDRFELAGDALQRINEAVTGPVVARIDPVILFMEGQQARMQRCGTTGLVLRAVMLMYTLERPMYEEAGRLIRQALEANPEDAKAAAWGAYWQVWYVGQGWSDDPAQGVATAQKLALRAISIDPESAEALGIYAHICAFLDKDFDSAMHYFERALRLNPNLAFVWALSAPTYCYIGKPEIALKHLDHYRDLAPFDHYYRYWESAYTIAYTFKGDYEKAASVGRRTVKANPAFSNGYKPLIAALGHLGRRDEAAPYVQKLLSMEPNFTVAHFGKVYPFKRPEDRERYMEGLRLAGVPEG